MSKKISVTCPKWDCGHENVFDESDLVSEILVKNEDGIVVDQHQPVEVDANTFIQCEKCKGPVNCANANISD